MSHEWGVVERVIRGLWEGEMGWKSREAAPLSHNCPVIVCMMEGGA
jgi:hypothetical protein